MTQFLQALSRSNSVKLATIGVLILVLLIPTAMIDGVISDRAQLADEAHNDIMTAWGRQQTLVGPILVVPYEHTVLEKVGPPRRVQGVIYHLPKEANTRVELDSQLRYRGLYTVPVYEAQLELDARFDELPLNELGLRDAKIDFSRAQLIVALSDPRTLREAPLATVDEMRVQFGAGTSLAPALGPHIAAPLSDVALELKDGAIKVATSLHFAGTDSIHLAPVGDANSVTMAANWANPSFDGQYLPTTREVTDTAFTASWKLTGLGRNFPSYWVNNSIGMHEIRSSLFGATLKTPLGTYALASRAVRYAVLAIALSFACFFLFEVVSGLHLHAVQYLLVGCANCLFFLLLLTFAEHIGFSLAYGLSASASIALIGGYSITVLQARLRAGIFAGALVALYAFVFMTLRAQNYALLAGSVGLWLMLAAVMYLTRRVDWHAAGGVKGESTVVP